MRQLVATVRHRPGPLVGTFVALVLAALVVTVATTLGRVGQTMTVPVQRLAATSAVVTGPPNVSVTSGSGDSAQTSVLPAAAYRLLPTSLAPQLAAVPGVAAAVPDVSVPVALQASDGRVVTGSSSQPITGHGWESAVLTPFSLRSGSAPTGPDQLVVGAGLVRSAGLGVGSSVRLVGRDLGPFEVVGVAGTATGNPAPGWTVFFSDTEAAALSGHPGRSDLIGVLARPGAATAALDAGLRRVAAAHGATVSFGSDRGTVEDLAADNDGSDLKTLVLSAGIDLAVISLFVAAGAVALSVAQRARTIALLRAVGASPGQVRRMVALELAVIGLVAGAVAYLPGVWLSSWALRGMAAHQLVPSSAHASASPWLLLITVGAGLATAELSGVVAGRRASRTPPAAALTETRVERRRAGVVRTVLGSVALGGGVALGITALHGSMSASQQLSLTLSTLLTFIIAVALLGPLLVTAAELAIRLPMRVLSPVAGRLALAEVRVRPRRLASAVVAVALAVAFVGTLYVVDATQTHAATVQSPQRLAASEVVSAPGPGLAPDALAAIQATPGVAAAIGTTSTTVFAPDPGSESTLAEAVTSGPLDTVLHLKVVAGTLAHFGPGDIALSQLVAGNGAIGAHVGQRITTYLADGTPYRATVTAIYARSVGFADALVPWAAAGGGHLGAALVGDVLVHDTTTASPATVTASLSSLASRFPGLHVASRNVANAQAVQQAAQSSYVNNLALALVLLLAAVTLVNTLVVSTLERREAVFLLGRVGATVRQLLTITAWQSAMLSVLGIVVGTGVGAVAVVGASKALTGSWRPYVPWPVTGTAFAVVFIVGMAATLGPTMGLVRGITEDR